MNVATKAPAFVVVFEVERGVRVVSPASDADMARVFAWIMWDEARARAFRAACEVAAEAAA